MSFDPLDLPDSHPLKQFWLEQKLELTAHVDEKTKKLIQVDIAQNGRNICVYRMESSFADTVIRYVEPEGKPGILQLLKTPEQYSSFGSFMENIFKKDYPRINGTGTKYHPFPTK